MGRTERKRAGNMGRPLERRKRIFQSWTQSEMQGIDLSCQCRAKFDHNLYNHSLCTSSTRGLPNDFAHFQFRHRSRLTPPSISPVPVMEDCSANLLHYISLPRPPAVRTTRSSTHRLPLLHLSPLDLRSADSAMPRASRSADSVSTSNHVKEDRTASRYGRTTDALPNSAGSSNRLKNVLVTTLRGGNILHF